MTEHLHLVAVAIALLLAVLLGGRHLSQPDPSLNPANSTSADIQEVHGG